MTRRYPWKAYRDHMSHVDVGLAMWRPDQPKLEITIGDIGFIDQETGQFQRLFNATRPPDDPLNKASLLPHNYSILHYNSILESHAPNYIQSGLLGQNAKRVDSISKAQAGNEPDVAAKEKEIDIRFTCTESKGAFLFLDDAADRRSVYKNESWVRYIKNNYPTWIAWLESAGLRDIELVVVRGWVKASAWAMAVWPDKKAAEYEITLSGKGGIAEGGVVLETSEGSGYSPYYHAGPQGRQGVSQASDCSLPRPRDQCIFMSYFKVVERGLWLLLKAQAGHHNLPPDDGGDGGNGPAPTEAAETRDPLDDVVDYIFSKTEAKIVIVCDADLYELCNGCQIPPDFPAYLRNQEPKIDMIDDDVAYLSIFESIYKSHENQGPPPEPATMAGDQGPYVAKQEPDEPLDSASGETSAVPITEMSGTITLPRESHTPIKWPHVVLLDPIAEGGAPCPAALSKNGAYVGIGFEDHCVRVWNVETEELEHQLRGHDDTVLCTAFSPDSKTLVSGSADYSLLMWSMETGAIIRRLEGHDGDVWSAAFSPNGKILATGSVDTMVRFWSVATGETMAIGEGHTADVQNLLFIPDGSLVVSCADMVCRVWDPRNGTGLSVMMGHTGVIWSLSCSHNGSKIATGSGDHTARVWSVDTGDELVTIRDHTGPVWSVQFSPDDRKVISGSYDAAITIHDTLSGELYFTLRADDCVVHSVAWSLAGNFIVGGYADGSLKMWDAMKGTKIAELRGHTDNVKSVMFSPDEDNVITSSYDGTVRVWSTVDVMKVS